MLIYSFEKGKRYNRYLMYMCLQLHYSVFQTTIITFVHTCKALYDKIILTSHYFNLMLYEIEYQSTISMAS